MPSTFTLNYLITFVISIFCAGILIPQILLIAFRKQLFDVPDQRKIHRGVVPRLGGIAFTPVICFCMACMLAFNTYFGDMHLFESMLEGVMPISTGLCALLILFIVGMADDLIGVRYIAKFAIQIICSLFLIFGGLGVLDYHGFLWIEHVSPWIGFPMTIFYIVFVTNAVNLIDGIDGLASGLSAIAFILYGVTFATMGEMFYSMLSWATLGVLVPFFYFNVFGNAEKRKKIFMGDTGSLTIGLMLSFLSLRMLTLPEVIDGTYSEAGLPNVMMLVLSPLMVPCFDVVRVYFRRVRHHNNPFLPDKTHIHHKLLACGMRQRYAMVSIISFSMLLCMFNIWLSRYMNITVLLLIDIAIWTVGNIIISRRIEAVKRHAQG